MTNSKKFNPAVFASIIDQTPHPVSWENIVAHIRGSQLCEATGAYRQLVGELAAETDADKRRGLENRLGEIKRRRLPVFLPSAVVEGGRGAANVKGYTNCILTDIDHVPDDRMAEVLQRVKSDPHTFLCYVTVSGHGIRALALTDCEVKKENFQQIWYSVNNYYSMISGCETDNQCSNATRVSCMCHDPEATFNPAATPFKVFEVMKTAASGIRTKQHGGRRASASSADPIVRKLVECDGAAYTPGHHNDYIARCLYMMNRFGVPLDDATQWALNTFADYEEANHNVAATAKSCYKNTAEHNTLSVRNYTGYKNKRRKDEDDEDDKEKKLVAVKIRDWCKDHIEARFNIFLYKVELRFFEGDDTAWHFVSDREEHTLWVKLQEAGIAASPANVHSFLNSDFSVRYNPLKDYIDHCEPWDGVTDHLGAMASMVHLKEKQELWQDAFKRWMVAMMAGVIFDRIVNHTILVLIGEQGVYKTTFVNNILPPELFPYLNVVNNVRNFNKDEALKLCENMIVNWEEIDEMQPADLNRVKALVTQLHINERQAYGRNKDNRPHIASFIATGNNKEFLCDATGNRRWMPFNVDYIDDLEKNPVNYHGVYAQAWYLLQHGFKYWYDITDIKRNKVYISQFETPQSETELILAHFRKPKEGETPKYLTSSQILIKLNFNNVKITVAKLGRAMRRLGFNFVTRRGVRFWIVVERPLDQIEKYLPAEDEAQTDASAGTGNTEAGTDDSKAGTDDSKAGTDDSTNDLPF